MINNTAKAIQLKQYDQKQYNHYYGQNNTIKLIQSKKQSEQLKRYDQQYNQDKSSAGNGYIVSNIYAKAKNLSKGPILGGYRKINSKTISDSIC